MQEKKRQLRKKLRLKREQLNSSYCEAADRKIRERLQNSRIYKDAELIFCYVSMSGEVDTKELIVEALREGKRVAVPKCEAKGVMEAVEITGMEDLEPTAWGSLEPKQGCPRVSPKELDLCIVPCVSCSSTGVRLGYGGGYYDRYLPGTDAVRVILCREQMLCEEIPREEHDCRMDVLITEKL